jgi:Mg2+ and Co2+ transporter CorA
VPVLPPPGDDCGACDAREQRIGELEDLAGELRDAVGSQADVIAVLREQVARQAAARPWILAAPGRYQHEI